MSLPWSDDADAVDLFRVGEIPVRARKETLLLPVLIYASWRSLPATILISACVLGLVLIHELGHALPAARQRLRPRIVLHAFGGYCVHDRARTRNDDLKIVAGGPGLGIAAGAALLGLSAVVGDVPAIGLALGPLLALLGAWSIELNLLNLLPIRPLDGSTLTTLLLGPRYGWGTAQQWVERMSLGLCVLGLAAALTGFWPDAPVILLAFLTWYNLPTSR